MFSETLSQLEQSGTVFYALIGNEWLKVKIIQILDDQVKLRLADNSYDVVSHFTNVIIKESA